MIIYEPVEAHAPLGEDDYCAAHDREPGRDRWDADAYHRRLAASGTRAWQITTTGARALWIQARAGFSFADVGPEHEPSALIALAPGTRLRLDSVKVERCYTPEDHESTTRRFCVLDGPFAGTCWSANESVAHGSDWRSDDPVDPLA